MPNEYREQRLVSDFLWELIERYDITKPKKLDQEYRIDLHFADGAWSTFKGREPVGKAFEPIHIGRQGRALEFLGGEFEDIKPKRQLHIAWVIAPADKRPKKIIGEIEKLMDVMKLDFSYKVPKLVPLRR
jgi:hypothetical protein